VAQLSGPPSKVPEFSRDMGGEDGVVGPHQASIITAVAPRLYSDGEVKELEHGTKKLLYVYGRVVYKDAFGITRHAKSSSVARKLHAYDEKLSGF
jgi:hypothetical protein